MKVMVPSLWFGCLALLLLLYLARNIGSLIVGFTKMQAFRVSLFLLFAVVGSFSMLWFALYNGYPTLYPDSAGYLEDFTGFIRPIGYNLFIRLTSLSVSPWGVVVFQAFLSSLLLMRSGCVVFQRYGIRHPEVLSFIILLAVVGITDISKYASWIMPDIFAGWMLLGGFLFMVSSRWYDRLLASIVMSVAIVCHLSNIMVACLSLTLLWIAVTVCRERKAEVLGKLYALTFIFIISVLSVLVLNFSIREKFELSYERSANFYINHLINWGVVSKVLVDQCPAKDWKLCKYQDFLKPQRKLYPFWFLWHEDSPIKQIGGWEDQREQNEILDYALRDYLPEIIRRALNDAFIQFNVYDDWDHLDEDHAKLPWLYSAFQKRYPKDSASIINSRQAKGSLDKLRLLPFPGHAIQNAVYWIGALLVLCFIVNGEWFLARLYVSSFVFIMINAVVLGSLNGVIPRLQGRVMWLVPYCLFLTLATYIGKKWNDRCGIKAAKN